MKRTLRQDASHGDPYACLALGYFYETGKEMGQNIPMAVEWYRRAADLGCARAHLVLAQMYLDGNHVEKDTDKYLNHLTRSAELGNPQAQLDLGFEYVCGRYMDKDPEVAFMLFNQSASRGNNLAKFAVGYMLANGIGTERSVSESETWFSSVAISGDAELFLKVGMGYEFGIFMMRRDLVEAARWYKYGVDMGHEKCIICWKLTLMTMDGSKQESLESRQARLMSTESQNELDEIGNAMDAADRLFEAGDEAGAYDYYSLAADLGSPEAMFTLAMMHHQGIAVKRDDKEALRLLVRAADAGSADAQFYLAMAYDEGPMPADDSQIVKLYADAASNGFLAAFYYLGKYVDHPETYVRRTHTGV